MSCPQRAVAVDHLSKELKHARMTALRAAWRKWWDGQSEEQRLASPRQLVHTGLQRLAASRKDFTAAPYFVDKQAQRLAASCADPAAALYSVNKTSKTLAAERAARPSTLTLGSAPIYELLDHGGVEGWLEWTSGSRYNKWQRKGGGLSRGRRALPCKKTFSQIARVVQFQASAT